MLKTCLMAALRSLRRQVGYTFVNVAGLAVGMAYCVLIVLFVRDELAYDRFHERADRIYRITSDWGEFSVPSTNPPLLKALKTDYPELTVAHLLRYEALVRRETEAFRQQTLFANPDLFEVFTLPLERGDPAAVLARPFTAVLSPEVARRIFGEQDPIGQRLYVDNQFEVEITGLLEPVPDQSHVRFDLLVSWATLDALFDYSNSTSWGNNSIYTYLLLPEGMAAAALEAQLPDLIARHAGENWNGATLGLQALTDVHLHSHHNMELAPNGHVAYVYVFSIVALFILLVACINFVNLATARAADRAREVGVRKVAGAHRRQLILQFLVESVLLASVAVVLSALLVVLALPLFRQLSGKALALGVLGDGTTLAAFAAVALFAGILAGSYPAFVLSSFRPALVLKGTFRTSRRGASLRRGLVVFQFATSIFLLIGTMVVYRQLAYLRTANVGFDREQVLVLDAPDDRIAGQYPAFEELVRQTPGVLAVSISSEGLPSELLDGDGFRLEGAPEDSAQGLRSVAVGFDFFETLGVPMAAGRSYDRNRSTDSTAFIVNRAALAVLSGDLDEPLGPEEAVGRTLHTQFDGQPIAWPIVGVTEDFNMASLHEEIEPVVFFFRPARYDHFLVRVAPGTLDRTLAGVEAAWERLYPEWPISYRFADQAFEAQYRAEERLGRIFSIFAGLAAFIACLGLFGLAAFTTRQRTKEIGVRKVLGASATGIALLLSRDFLRLVAIAGVVAVPAAYLAAERWLGSFAYRIDVVRNADVFLWAGGVALVVALLTVSYQAFRAAFMDPVRTLRYE